MRHRLGLAIQGHRSVSVSRHFLLQAPQCPCSVRKRFSRDHCCRGRSKPVLTTSHADFLFCIAPCTSVLPFISHVGTCPTHMRVVPLRYSNSHQMSPPSLAHFYRATFIKKRGLCRHAVSVRYAVSVRPSVTFVYSVETNKHIFKYFFTIG